MTDEITGEDRGDCGCALVRVSADDVANPHNYPVVTCPTCLEVDLHDLEGPAAGNKYTKTYRGP